MLKINDQKRGSGKTTKAIEMLREDKNSILYCTILDPQKIISR